MIDSLYEKFQPWSVKGSIYIISDTHFDDPDCKLMDPNWIDPIEQVKRLRVASKNDTLIHLGDVGNPEYLRQLRCYKVLVMGNHDQSPQRFRDYFDEIYEGPLFISKKILLSHEPINPIEGLKWCFNIHGHDHSGFDCCDRFHLNVAANMCGYTPVNLGEIIKKGKLANIKSIHRITIDEAARRKREDNLISTYGVSSRWRSHGNGFYF